MGLPRLKTTGESQLAASLYAVETSRNRVVSEVNLSLTVLMAFILMCISTIQDENLQQSGNILTMKIISFSIWGSDPTYCNGAIENARISNEIYPGWTVRVYHDTSVPQECVDKLKSLNAETVLIPHSRGQWDGLFWRFYPVSEDVERVIIRDTDSRLNWREKSAVDDWITSGYPFHCMRDHCEHNVPIMGGMWGVVGGYIKDIQKMIETWTDFYHKGTDQTFLERYIWPRVRDHAIVHDRFHEGVLQLPDGSLYPLRQSEEVKNHYILADGRQYRNTEIYKYTPMLFGMHLVKPFPPHAETPVSHVGARHL